MKLLIVSLMFAASPIYGFFFGEDRIEPHTEATPECQHYAEVGSCQFYQCLEDRFPCGHRGFPLKVGLHFCRKMTSMSGLLTPSGRTWMNGTSRCLTNSLLSLYNSPFLRCGDIKDVGASSMVECNSREESDGTDFCWFVRENAEFYENLFEASDIGRLLSLRSPSVIAKMLTEAASCGATTLRDRMAGFTSDVSSFFQGVFARVDEFLPWD